MSAGVLACGTEGVQSKYRQWAANFALACPCDLDHYQAEYAVRRPIWAATALLGTQITTFGE